MKSAASLMALLSVVSIGATQDDSGKKDLASLHGEWRCVSWLTDLDDPPNKGHRFTFEGDKMIILAPGLPPPGGLLIKLDPSKNPKSMDVFVEDVDGRKRTLFGIYSLDGDTLKIAWDRGGVKRPTNFNRANNVTTAVLTREK